MATAADFLIQQGLERGRTEGVLEGKVESLLAVLEARGLTATELQRQRLLTCRDADMLDRWLRGVLTAKSVDDLLST